MNTSALQHLRLFFSLVLALSLNLLPLQLSAGEGMWIPMLLGALNEADMQAAGMKLSAEDIYSVNHSSLKDAILQFGGGCTGSIISDQGLILTNHHCGMSYVQRQSTQERNYLEDGFWAKDASEELPNEGLTATFLVRMESVTEQVLGDLETGLNEEQRKAKIARRIRDLETAAEKDQPYQANIVSFYQGNEYYLIFTEVYEDVRLVAAPPKAIGKFGGESDNWLWPRHNADFMMFRIYTSPDGKPAAFSEDNIPMKPKHHLPVSLEGVKEGDFTMVMGFPGRTEEYLPSSGLAITQELRDPVRVNLRAARLDVIAQAIEQEPELRLAFASKEAGIANAYKKWRGRIMGLRKNDAVAKKEAEEEIFQEKVASNPEWEAAYGELLPTFHDLYREMAPAQFVVDYFIEGGYTIEFVPFIARISRLSQAYASGGASAQEIALSDARERAGRFFRNYRPNMDYALLQAIVAGYQRDLPRDLQPVIIHIVDQQFSGDPESYANYVFANSSLLDSSRFSAFLDSFSVTKLEEDPAYLFMASLYQNYYDYQPQLEKLSVSIDSCQRVYMQALQEVFPEQTFYPDANFTFRVAYGKMEGMAPSDGIRYRPYTTLSGIIEKYDPEAYDFRVPERLRELAAEGDFGRYGEDGELRVAFIASNHTSGGNSGSPVLNATGQLIGLNFDRNWEGTMSDFLYDRRLCRNISVDVRYIMWLLDKYGEVDYLLEEMELVEGD